MIRAPQELTKPEWSKAVSVWGPGETSWTKSAVGTKWNIRPRSKPWSRGEYAEASLSLSGDKAGPKITLLGIL